MGYTLISRQKVDFNNTPVTQLDFTINADYDEIFFTVTGFKSTTDERNLGYQFITSGEMIVRYKVRCGDSGSMLTIIVTELPPTNMHGTQMWERHQVPLLSLPV